MDIELKIYTIQSIIAAKKSFVKKTIIKLLERLSQFNKWHMNTSIS